MAKDLLVLTACKDAQYSIRGILSRHESLGIRPPAADYYIHPNKDSGCVTTAFEILRAQTKRYAYALVLFDREGSGRDADLSSDIERDVRAKLANSGWGDRAEVIVLDPELEIWVWSSSPNVDKILGWFGRIPTLRAWLSEKGFLGEGAVKPTRPKEALEAALEFVGMQRSSSLYKELAEKVGLERCTDQKFSLLKQILVRWFPK